jgi:RNA ligase
MIKYIISELLQLVEQGYLRKSENEDLILFKYTEKCTFERYWNNLTMACRGLVLEKSTGLVVAKPFEKFFNLNEVPQSAYINLPNESYTIHSKEDGSLGIIFNYKGKWCVATCGSLSSQQSQEAQKMLSQYNLDNIPKNYTLLVEIIYPENKIVVNYGNRRELILLGIFNRETGQEILNFDICDIPKAITFNITIEDAIKQQKTISKDQEGFIVRFNSGLRVKIKGEEYVKIHRIISNMSPLSIWEVMENGKVAQSYIENIPEEYRDEITKEYVIPLEDKYKIIKLEIKEQLQSFYEPTMTIKDVALRMKSSPEIFTHMSGIFAFLSGKGYNRYIMNQIRPNGNKLKE